MTGEVVCPVCGAPAGRCGDMPLFAQDQRFVALREIVVPGVKVGVSHVLARPGDRLSERQVVGHGLVVGVDVIEAPEAPPLDRT